VCLETTGKPCFCFNAFLFCYFVSILFCCTTVLSWTTARNISLSILSQLFQFFSYPRFFESLKIIIIIISKFIKRHVCLKHHVCLQKAAEALVRYGSDSLVTAFKQECLKVSFMFRIAQHDFCRQTVPNDRCGVGE